MNETLKLALEFLEDNEHYVAENERHIYVLLYNEVIKKCKAALAQPAQEPVAVVETLGGYPDESRHEAKWLVPYRALKDGDNLYTTPPQPEQEPDLVEVSSFEFVSRVAGKEDVIGKPMFWAKWPSKENK